MADTLDITDTIQAKSDQLNADDLLGGSITVRIKGVGRGDADQPLVVSITGHRPWKPCKSDRRVLASAWGTDARQWVGRWVTLYRDPTVTWAGQRVGGVRIQAMSDLDQPLDLMLTATRGKKIHRRIDVLAPPEDDTPDLDTLLGDAGTDGLDAWLTARGRPVVADMTDEQRTKTAQYLTSRPDVLAEVTHASE